MWILLLVTMISETVTGVITRQNMTFPEETSNGRETYTSGPSYYDYYESQDSTMDTSGSYYVPVSQYYPSLYRPVQHYPQYETPKQHPDWSMDVCSWGRTFMEHMWQMGAAKFGLMGLAKAIGTGVLTKLSLILFKLIAIPIGLIILKLPLLLPILIPALLLFLPIPIFSQQCKTFQNCEDLRNEMEPKTIEQRVTRAFQAFVKSENCVGRLACELGSLNADSQYKEQVKRSLEHLQRSAPESEKSVLEAYSLAYTQGNEGMSCNNGTYPCDLGHVASAVYDPQF